MFLVNLFYMEVHFYQLVVEERVDDHHIEVFLQGAVVDYSLVVLFYVLYDERHDELNVWTCLNHVKHLVR